MTYARRKRGAGNGGHDYRMCSRKRLQISANENQKISEDRSE